MKDSERIEPLTNDIDVQSIGEPLTVSVIIPVFNEADSLPLLHQALHNALDNNPKPWEVVYVDDGSNDESVEMLATLARDDPVHTCVVEFLSLIHI